MTDNVRDETEDRLQAHFGLFGNGAEQESDTVHIQHLGEDWQPTAEESAELPDYEGGQDVLDNISRFLANRAEYISKCGYKLSGLLQQLDADVEEAPDAAVAADAVQPAVARTTNAIDVQDLPMAGVILVGAPATKAPEAKPRGEGERREARADRQQGRQDRRPNQTTEAAAPTPAPELSFPPKVEPKKPSVLPAAVVQLLQLPTWHSAREAIEQALILSRKEGDANQPLGQQRLAGWKARMTHYQNGCAGFDKCNFGRHMAVCINELELGINPNSPKYQYHYVTGIKPADEPVP